VVFERASQQVFFGTSAVLFVGSTGLTLTLCSSMTAMGKMPMPGGWTMSMTWMRMPGQTWAGAGISFLGMWLVMMIAMMLPSLAPMLSRYRRVLGAVSERRLGWLTVIVATGYFFIWTLFGMAVYSLGVVLAAMEMRQPALALAVPMATGIVVLVAGAIQFTHWKAHNLALCCEERLGGYALPVDAGAAWRTGLRFGIHCSSSCLNLTAILLVLGVMDLRAMAVITAAITSERLAPGGKRVSRIIGAVVFGAGLLMIARAASIPR